MIMDKQQVEVVLQNARDRLSKMSLDEKEAGFAPPENCDILSHLRTAREAIFCSISTKDFQTVAEGCVMVDDVIKRIETQVVKVVLDNR